MKLMLVVAQFAINLIVYLYVNIAFAIIENRKNISTSFPHFITEKERERKQLIKTCG